MLIMGVCNPTGEADTYNGLYMTATELSDIVRDNKMRNLPVKTEHAGSEVGHVVTSFLDASGNLNCVMQLGASSIAAALAQGFVRDGLALDLSLGYTLDDFRLLVPLSVDFDETAKVQRFPRPEPVPHMLGLLRSVVDGLAHVDKCLDIFIRAVQVPLREHVVGTCVLSQNVL